MNRKIVLLLAAALLAPALPAAAQESRAEAIQRARGEFDPAAALDMLMRAADPTIAPPDSLWAVGVYDLALTLSDMGEEDEAELWLRWISRHGGEWPMDPAWFPPSLVAMYERQAAAVAEDPAMAEAAARTSWGWEDEFEMQASGSLRIDPADAPPGLTVSIEGRGAVEPGEPMTLPPGTYRLEATAEGHEPVQVSREVLPGVTTVLSFDLPPEFTDEVRERVAGSLVSIRANLGAGEVCTNGVVRRNGLVLTTLSDLPRTSDLEVVTGDGVRHPDLSVVERDETRDLAVLRLGGSGASPLEAADDVDAGQYAWSLYRPACGSPTTGLTRLGDWPARPTGRVELAAPLDADALGAPLVDPSGALLGIVVGPNGVVPLSAAEELLGRALSVVAQTEPVQMEGGGGGFPLKWVGAGAAVVGVAAVVLAGGGGGNGNERSGIRITLPGGAP